MQILNEVHKDITFSSMIRIFNSLTKSKVIKTLPMNENVTATFLHFFGQFRCSILEQVRQGFTVLVNTFRRK